MSSSLDDQWQIQIIVKPVLRGHI